MPRKYHLTHLESTNRWQKKYHKKTFYFPIREGESKEESYRRVWQEWTRAKAIIDGQLLVESAHQKAWAAQMEFYKALMDRHQREDKVTGYLHAEEFFKLSKERFDGNYAYPGIESPGAVPLPEPPPKQRPWENVIEAKSNSLGSCVTRYEAMLDKRVRAKALASATARNCKQSTREVLSILGHELDASTINGETLNVCHSKMAEKVDSGTYGAAYAKQMWASFRAFIRWLWKQEIIENLPRNLDDCTLSFSAELKKVEVFTLEEIKSLLGDATEHLKLWTLLLLNLGCNSADLGQLKQEEIDWELAIITRRRVKTGAIDSVPTVSFPIWSCAMELLRKYNTGSDPVLLTPRGTKLWESTEKQKVDRVYNAFNTLTKKLGINKSVKMLRKTAADLIDKKYGQKIADLFMGHSPTGVAQRHYVTADQATLNEAVLWLEGALGIGSTPNSGS